MRGWHTRSFRILMRGEEGVFPPFNLEQLGGRNAGSEQQLPIAWKGMDLSPCDQRPRTLLFGDKGMGQDRLEAMT